MVQIGTYLRHGEQPNLNISSSNIYRGCVRFIVMVKISGHHSYWEHTHYRAVRHSDDVASQSQAVEKVGTSCFIDIMSCYGRPRIFFKLPGAKTWRYCDSSMS